MTGYEEAEKVMKQNYLLVQADESNETLIPVNVAMYLMTKLILRLAQSLENDRVTSLSPQLTASSRK
jgi:hypothetical protein